jgi:predicted nucleic acid-binding protein
MRLALDTNVLAYAEGVNGASMKKAALEIIGKLPGGRDVLASPGPWRAIPFAGAQGGPLAGTSQGRDLELADAFPLIETSPAVLLAATDLATHHRLGIWDAVVFSATAAAGCRLLLSEGLQAGFTWNGVTVTNPFAPAKHELLAALLDA